MIHTDKPGKPFHILFVLGFISILTQLVIIREFLNVFQGNELIIALIFSTWMLLTAAGSRIATCFNIRSLTVKEILTLLVLEGFLATLMVVLLYIFENKFIEPGVTKGLTIALMFSVVLLLPFCLLSGALFTFIASLTAAQGRKNISNSYGWETFGSVLAGIAFSIGFACLLSTFQVLSLVFLICLLTFIILYPSGKHTWRFYLLIVASLAFLVILPTGIADQWIRSLTFRDQEIVYTKDTPYGNVTVTFQEGQYNVFENGTLLFSSQSNQSCEEAVHFAMLQRDNTARVMVVSGGISGMAKQVLKYPSVIQVDYIEINPWLISAEKFLPDPLHDNRIHLISSDARIWISQLTSTYDIIIINTPDPINAQINRYYTREFFEKVKRALKPGGIFEIGLGSTANYMSDEAALVHGIIYKTLKSVFQYVDILPASRNYFLASSDPVDIHIASKVQQTSFENEFVNAYFIDDELTEQYNHDIMKRIKMSDRINSDLEPYAYFVQVIHWIKKYDEKNGLLPILVAGAGLVFLLLIIVIKGISPVAAGIFTGAFAGASAEFLIIVIFQVLYGYIYQMLGVIIGLYMGGLSIGALININFTRRQMVRLFLIVQLMMILLLMLVPLIASVSARNVESQGWILQIIIYAITLLIAFIAGFEFNIASRLDRQDNAKTAGHLYALDLSGAAIGTILTSFLFLPLMGLTNTCVVITLMILISLLILLFLRKRYV
jgi:spermidine synthase